MTPKTRAFTVRASAEQSAALRRLQAHCGEVTANRAIWFAVENYVETYRRLQEAEGLALSLQNRIQRYGTAEEDARQAEAERAAALAALVSE